MENDSSSLRDAEQSGGKPEAGATVGEEKNALNYTGDGGKGKKGGLKSLTNLSRGTKNKILLAGGVTGGLGVVSAIIFLFIIASSLAIPNLMQNITTYEFARVTRDYAKSAQRVTTEKLAISATDDATYSGLRGTYKSVAGKVADQWSKLDKYRPEKVMKNLVSDNNFKITYQRTALGRLQLKGVTLGDQSFLPVKRTALQRFTPGLNSVLEFKDSVALTKTVAPALDSALRAQDIGPIIRSSVAKNIRQELGINLVAWTLGKYKGKNEAQARLEEARQKAAVIDEKAPVNDAVTSSTKDAVDKATNETKAVLNDPTKLQQVINSGGIATTVRSVISSVLAGSGLQAVVSFVNPVYGIAMPICIVYDGSLNHSGSTIETQTRQQQGAFYYLGTAADQQKAGAQDVSAEHDGELAAAVKATNDDVGPISESNALKRANGDTIDTSGSISAEASAGGEYTLLNATPGIPTAVADTINSLADGACPYLTNIWGGIGLGLVNIGIGLGSGGTTAGAEKVAGTAATNVIENTSSRLAVRLLSKAATKVSNAKQFLYDTGKSVGKVAAATVIAKLIVNSRCGCMNGGFTQGTPLANEADSGGNIQAGEIERQGQYGRPLTSSEVAQSDQADRKQIATLEKSKSPFERYLATSNANSLVSRMAIGVRGNLNTSIFRSILNLGTMILRPLTYAGSLVTSLNGTALAGASDTHYGNAQFGWSDAEQNIINSTESYHSSLENQAALDASGKEDEISSKYEKCFTGKLSDLLTEGDIIRDEDGNVIPDKGLCSPNNLGVNNPDYGDLVFRYRLAKSYANTVDQLIDDQEITSSNSNTSGTSTAATPTGLNTSAAETAAQKASTGGTTVGYSLYDAGGTNISSYNQDTPNYGASITKAMLLVAYLNQVGSGSLSATAKTNLTAMIENSDNTAANWVYHQLSDPSGEIAGVAKDAGMTSFNINTGDTVYVLGQSTITASDFARMFAAINVLLPSSQQSFGLDLLSHLSSADQNGLLQAGLPGTVYSKEGWKPEPSGSKGAPYVVNQAAQFTLNGRTYGVAVTVGGTANQASGETIVKSVVAALMSK
jgi:hypothetical protein